MGRQLLHRDARRAAILAAAAAAFARGGFAATSMTDVANEAGVTRILLYRHFDSKEALYRAVLDDVTTAMRTAWGERDRTLPGTAAVAAHLSVARADPDGYRLLWLHADREPEFASYVANVRRGVGALADDLVGPHVPAPLRRWASVALASYVTEAVLDWLDHGTPDHDAAFVTHASAGLRGLVLGIVTGQ